MNEVQDKQPGPCDFYCNVSWSGILPVTKVTAEDDAALDSYPLNYPVGYDFCNRIARDASCGAVGCPLGIQVVGRHYQEEMVVHVMEIIENLIKNKTTDS